jgi:tetratricopeptide (TPR) repeat protein
VKEDPVEVAAALRRRAVATGAAGQPVRAARMLNRALDVLNRATPSDAVIAVYARVLASLAYFEAEQGRVELGLELVDQARRFASGLNDPSVHGLLHLQRGSILVRRGSLRSALSELDQAVRLLHDDPEYQCRTLLNRSALHLYGGNLSAADADLRLCASVSASHGLEVLHAKAQFNLGYLTLQRGDLPGALRAIDASLRDPALLTRPVQAIALGGRAEALRAAGLTREADADLAEAVHILRRERLTHDLAEALLARTQVALLDRRWDDARRLAGQARRQFDRRGNAAWADLARLMALQAQLASGRRLAFVADDALRLAGRLRASDLTEDARVAALVAARALLARGEVSRAAAIVEGTSVDAAGAGLSVDAVGAAVSVAAAVSVDAAGKGAGRLVAGDRIGTRLLARLVRAELAGAVGARARRAAEVRGGLADVHRYQSRFGSLDLQTASALHGRELAELGLADAVRDGRPAVVFAWSERARALAARLPPVHPPDDPRAAEMLAELRGVRTALRAAELAGQRVPDLRRRRSALERQVRQRAWFTAGPADVERPVSLAAVRDSIGDGVLVTYLTVRGTLHALVARPHSARLLPLGPLAEVTAALQRVRADLDAAALTLIPAPMRTVVLRSLTAGLRRLDATLWRPLADLRSTAPAPAASATARSTGPGRSLVGDGSGGAGQALASAGPGGAARSLVGDGPVVIVPTSELGAVPWTLLPGLAGRPLTVVPSATWWLAARARTPAGGPPVFAVGPGVPRGEAEVHAAASAWLPAAPVRDQHDPVVLTGVGASAEAVLKAAEHARLLHVAAHGVHEPDNPLFSSIQLADGPLFGYDLPRAAALPSHVVLSACDLGLAEVRPGDEALGMTSALLYGGVASVVAGVGRVGDEVASTTMIAYHAHLAAGRAPAEALAQALSGTLAPLVCFGAGS